MVLQDWIPQLCWHNLESILRTKIKILKTIQLHNLSWKNCEIIFPFKNKIIDIFMWGQF